MIIAFFTSGNRYNIVVLFHTPDPLSPCFCWFIICISSCSLWCIHLSSSPPLSFVGIMLFSLAHRSVVMNISPFNNRLSHLPTTHISRVVLLLLILHISLLAPSTIIVMLISFIAFPHPSSPLIVLSSVSQPYCYIHVFPSFLLLHRIEFAGVASPKLNWAFGWANALGVKIKHRN